MKILSREKELIYKLVNKAETMGLSHLNLDAVHFTGRHITLEGKKFLYLANCSYLGLENDPRIVKAANEAAVKYGIILSNSRAYFSSPLYYELQELINKIIPGYSIITTTTTLGHCSALPLLVDKDDLIIMDMYAHNSLQMAAKLCLAKGTRIKYLRQHNDMQKLNAFVNHPDNNSYKRIWFLGDGIYSMQGDFIDIVGLKKLLDQKDNLFAYIDDAHGFSWTGKNGAGFVMGHPSGLHPKLIVAVSMCKSFGCAGGIISFPSQSLRDRIDLIGQTQIFSAPIPNPVLGAAIASAKIHLSPNLEQYQQELLTIVAHFRERCQQEGITLKTKSMTPIQFIEIGKSERVYEVTSRLMAHGIYCTGAVFPSMPRNHGGFRISLTRYLLKDDVDYFIDVFKKIIDV